MINKVIMYCNECSEVYLFLEGYCNGNEFRPDHFYVYYKNRPVPILFNRSYPLITISKESFDKHYKEGCIQKW